MDGAIDVDAVIANADRDFPALFQLFGGYFHQDWTLEYDSWQAAMTAFNAEAPPEARQEAARELSNLLAAELDDTTLARILYPGFDCNFIPSAEDMSSEEWLRLVHAALVAPR